MFRKLHRRKFRRRHSDPEALRLMLFKLSDVRFVGHSSTLDAKETHLGNLCQTQTNVSTDRLIF